MREKRFTSLSKTPGEEDAFMVFAGVLVMICCLISMSKAMLAELWPEVIMDHHKLSKAIRRAKKRRGIAEISQYFLFQLLRGLKYVHSANVLHRDKLFVPAPLRCYRS
ncbi:mitogen-activated protein kinase mpkC-like [Amaranthus tricolor]|uniref:mitogen-activated protein kinase mpkC-like n=1 Tax=Amaranthus tricolor TaxID=29722 RepID=UPI0025837BEA|nr:mitogen-activated protein kinase mpkC-like [Amaranthus tricolor]